MGTTFRFHSYSYSFNKGFNPDSLHWRNQSEFFLRDSTNLLFRVQGNFSKRSSILVICNECHFFTNFASVPNSTINIWSFPCCRVFPAYKGRVWIAKEAETFFFKHPAYFFFVYLSSIFN